MQLVIKRDDLKASLDMIAPALGATDMDPIHHHFLFKVGPDSLKVLAGGGHVSFCGYTVCEGLPPTNVPDGKEVCFTAHGRRLVGFLGDVGDVNLHIDYSDNKMKIAADGGLNIDFNLQSGDVDTFPKFESDYAKAVEGGEKASFDKEALLAAFGFTGSFVGMKATNPGFQLCRVAEDGTMRTGNGKVVSIYRHSGFGGEFKVKGDKIKDLVTFIKASEGPFALHDGTSSYYLTSKGGSYIGVRKVTFDFPDIKGVDLFSKNDADHVISVDRNSLINALKRLQWGLDNDQVRMAFSLDTVAEGSDMDPTMKITATSHTGVVSEEVLKVLRPKGTDETTFVLHYQHFLEGLVKYSGDQVSMYVSQGKLKTAKLLEDTTENGVVVTKVLFLSLMRATE